MPAAQAPPEPGLSPPVARDAVEQAVRVINVNAGTQAERLDLRRGDLVVEYDGVQIRNSQQLVSIVRQKSDAETVEMVVVRDGEPLRMSLNGGLIGINVKTVAVPSAAMGEP
jgi:S1-C subfamily serine protease